MKKLAINILLFIISLPLISQDITVEAKLDSSDVLIGDHINYTVTVRQPSGIRLLMPEYTDSLYTGLEILSQTEIDTSYLDNDELFLSKNFTITSFDTGFYQIPPFYLELETNKSRKRFYSDYVPLRVSRTDITPPDSTDVVFDIIGPQKVGYSASEILPWILLAIAIIAGSWFFIKYWPWKPEKEKPEQARMPSEPIHIITLRELDKLEKKKLWQEGMVKQYYSELTDILRYYIEIRFNNNALEMTSEEILNHYSIKELREKTIRDLESILRNADLAKFAKYTHDEGTHIRIRKGGK